MNSIEREQAKWAGIPEEKDGSELQARGTILSGRTTPLEAQEEGGEGPPAPESGTPGSSAIPDGLRGAWPGEDIGNPLQDVAPHPGEDGSVCIQAGPELGASGIPEGLAKVPSDEETGVKPRSIPIGEREPDELQFVDSDIRDAFVGKTYPVGTPTQVQLSRVGKAFMAKMDQLGLFSQPERTELKGLRTLKRAVTGRIGPNSVPLRSAVFYSWARDLPQSQTAPGPESAIVQWLVRVARALECLGE
jgi:hypothetical protein